MGSDTPHKQELDAAILVRARRVVADSRAQAHLRGEIFKASAPGVTRCHVEAPLRRGSEGD